MSKWGMVVLLSVICIVGAEAKDRQKLNIGDIPPSYLGKDTHGQGFNLEEYKGKVVVITFWASWCAPCRKELPILDTFQKQVGSDHLQVVAVNFKENRKVFRKIKKKLDYMKLTITHDKRGSIGRKFGVNGIPHLFIIGRSGTIVYQAVGYGEESVGKIVKIINAQLRKSI